MKENSGLERLISLARRGRKPQEHEAPYGFSTRVVAQAFAARPDDDLYIWERAARWGVVMVIALCLLTTVLHHRVSEPSALADFAGLTDYNESSWE